MEQLLNSAVCGCYHQRFFLDCSKTNTLFTFFFFFKEAKKVKKREQGGVILSLGVQINSSSRCNDVLQLSRGTLTGLRGGPV